MFDDDMNIKIIDFGEAIDFNCEPQKVDEEESKTMAHPAEEKHIADNSNSALGYAFDMEKPGRAR